ncbi:hypothetical protein [Candidatus Poriferisocius sp.]|uniref:hypothetical protein n=1 Tax=Candidatus Poriferisocius sp. TaxID=3101276 RepID=UPI003B02CC98
MIPILYHEADGVISKAIRVLRDLSSHGLLNDMALVPIKEGEPPTEQPLATCVRASEATQTGLYDALARSGPPAESKLYVTAVVSGVLAPQAQLALARALGEIARKAEKLAGGIIVVPSCLAVPELRDGESLLPAKGFFTAQTANFVALPTDWQFASGMAAGIDFADAQRASWHAALELATLTSLWRATNENPWRPEIRVTGIEGCAFKFVRSSARLVLIRRRELAAEDFLPVADGFSPTPAPEAVASTVDLLHPAEFRLDRLAGEPGASGRRSNIMEVLGAGLGRIFPPLAAGLTGFTRMLRVEFSKAFGGDLESDDDGQASSAQGPAEADEATVVLKGFSPKVWTDLVRNVFGVVDGGRTAVAIRAREAAGNQEYVFVTPESLVDGVLEERIRAGGQRDEDEVAEEPVEEESVDAEGPVEEDEGEVAEEPADEGPVDAEESVDADEAELVEEPVDDDEGSFDEEPAGEEEAADHAEDWGSPRALLTLLDDKFCDEIQKAEDRRRQQQAELEKQKALRDSTEKFRPSADLVITVKAFLITLYTVLASYALLLDMFDLSDVSPVARTRISIGGLAVTCLFLLYSLTPQRDDPRDGQSYLLRRSFALAVLTVLGLFFAGASFADLFDSISGPDMVPFVFIALTLFLFVYVLLSPKARQRPASRALVLAWTICYLIASFFAYAKLDSSAFNKSENIRNFFEDWGEQIRYAALAVAGFLFLIALVMLVVSDRGRERKRRLAIAAIRELESELGRRELLSLLRGLRVNWLGTAVALDYILRWNIPAEPVFAGESRELRSPLFRLAARYRNVFSPPPAPGWLSAQYEAVVAAYSRFQTRPVNGDSNRPETSTMVSSVKRDLLEDPGPDPRWQFAHRLCSGEFDDALVADSSIAVDASLDDAEGSFLSEIAPVKPGKLPAGLVGPGAATLDSVEMDSTWWWPDGLEVPASDTRPRVVQAVRSPGQDSYLAVRLDISDPMLENQLAGGSTPPEDPDGEDPQPAAPSFGLG